VNRHRHRQCVQTASRSPRPELHHTRWNGLPAARSTREVSQDAKPMSLARVQRDDDLDVVGLRFERISGPLERDPPSDQAVQPIEISASQGSGG
jgi:hypothetical protein